MIHRLAELPKPPLTNAEFMTDFDDKYHADIMLARGLKTVLPQITEYLGMDDSRDVLKEPTLDTQNEDKETSNDNRNVNKELVDDSRDVLKEPTLDTQNEDKETSDDNRNVNKELVDDSRHVLKDRAPRTTKQGHAIEVTPITSGLTPRTSPSTLPALEALVQAT